MMNQLIDLIQLIVQLILKVVHQLNMMIYELNNLLKFQYWNIFLFVQLKELLMEIIKHTVLEKLLLLLD